MLLVCQQGQAAPRVQGFSVDYSRVAPVNTPIIDPVDKQGIIKAIQAGNEQRLVEIRGEIAANPTAPEIDQYLLSLVSAGLARINGDFAASNRALDRGLEVVGRHADTNHELNALLLLDESIRYGNLFLANDLAGWIKRTTWLENVYFSPIRRFYQLPNLQFPNLTLIKPLVPAASISNPSVIASDDEQLPLRVDHDRIDGQLPVDVRVQASILGETDWVLFDTATLKGVIPTEYVARHHLRVIASSERGSDGFNRNMHDDYVVVPEIRLGRTVLRNQLFSVAPIPFPVLGLLQLSQLRHLTIDAHTLRFGPHAPFDCHDPIHAASAIAGVEFRLLFPYSLEGREKTAVLDTGDNTPSVLAIRTRTLPAALQASARVKKLVTTAGKVSYRTATTPATVHFARFTAQDYIKYVQSPMQDDLIPNGILRHARFSLDMTDHVACLTPYRSDTMPE